MWGNDGRGAPGIPEQMGGRAPGEPLRRLVRGNERDEADARMELPGAEVVDDEGREFPTGTREVSNPAEQRARARLLIREFLRATPRSEGGAALAFLRPDGTERVLTRAELSVAVDRLRPRMRQIIRLAIEERWSRQRVCEYLRISIKTYERDHVEALDALVDM